MDHENANPMDNDEEFEEKTYLLLNRVKSSNKMQMNLSITEDKEEADKADYCFIIGHYDEEEDVGFILWEIINFLKRYENEM